MALCGRADLPLDGVPKTKALDTAEFAVSKHDAFGGAWAVTGCQLTCARCVFPLPRQLERLLAEDPWAGHCARWAKFSVHQGGLGRCPGPAPRASIGRIACHVSHRRGGLVSANPHPGRLAPSCGAVRALGSASARCPHSAAQARKEPSDSRSAEDAARGPERPRRRGPRRRPRRRTRAPQHQVPSVP